MKVAHIIGSLNQGGMESMLLDLFKTKEVAIDFIGIHRKRGVLYKDYLSTNIPLFELPVKKLSTFSFLKKLRNLLIKEKVEIAHCHQPIDALMVYFATIGLKTKIILSMHGHGIKDSWIGKRIRKFTINHADTVLFVSHFSKNYYINKFKLSDQSKLKVLLNGIDFKKFNSLKKINLKNEFNIQKDFLVFGSVGNFSSGRNQIIICRFLAKLILERDDFMFFFIGAKSSSEPELYENCVSFCQENGLEKNVKFLGSRQDVPQILQEFDAFVYSSVHDTFGIAIIEAIYSGMPVFLNDWKVMKEITDNGKHATIYYSNDEFDLLSKFIHFLENRKEYNQKTNLAKEFVEQVYSIITLKQNLKQIYQSVIKK